MSHVAILYGSVRFGFQHSMLSVRCKDRELSIHTNRMNGAIGCERELENNEGSVWCAFKPSVQPSVPQIHTYPLDIRSIENVFIVHKCL
jgi:hypothetical protein